MPATSVLESYLPISKKRARRAVDNAPHLSVLSLGHSNVTTRIRTERQVILTTRPPLSQGIIANGFVFTAGQRTIVKRCRPIATGLAEARQIQLQWRRPSVGDKLMEQPTRELKVPATIYERGSDCQHRSAESVMLDGLSLLFGKLPNTELEPEALKDFEEAVARACASAAGLAPRHTPARTDATRSIGTSH